MTGASERSWLLVGALCCTVSVAEAAPCLVCLADGTGSAECKPRAADYDRVCRSSQFPEDRDCDGYPDDCDSDPDAPAPVPPAAPISPPVPQESDNDKVITNDNCPLVANADQANSDRDGWGDVCDNCPAVASLDQADADNDGVGDVCDPCPGDPHVSALAAGAVPECSIVVTSFVDYEDRQRRARVLPLLRPTVRVSIGPNKEVAAGAHAMLTGSLDSWKIQNDGYAVPPIAFWHVGAYLDVTQFTDTPTRFGPILGIDVRPLGTPGFAKSWMKDFKLGLAAHYLTGSPDEDQGSKWVQRVGLSLNVGFLDIVSFSPGFQTDLAHDKEMSFSAFLLFDFKYLDDLGVADVRKLLPKH